MISLQRKTKVYLLALGTIFFWASAFPLTKIAMEHYSPNALGFLRCLVAAVLLVIIGLIQKIHLPHTFRDVLWFLLSGALGFALYMVLFNTGIQTLSSATSSIIVATTPIMTAVVASRLYHEHINRVGWFAILLAFAGVLIVLLWDGVFSINVGLIWTLCAAVVFCAYNLLTRKFSAKGYSALEIVTYSMICGAILLSVFAPEGIAQVRTATTPQMLAVLYLGAMPSATSYLLWGNAMALAEKTSDVTNFMFVTPLLSTVMAIALSEALPNAGTFLGGAVIITGIVLFNLKGK